MAEELGQFGWTIWGAREGRRVYWNAVIGELEVITAVSKRGLVTIHSPSHIH